MSELEQRVESLEHRVETAEFHIREETRRSIDAGVAHGEDIGRVSERLYRLEAKLKAAGIKLSD